MEQPYYITILRLYQQNRLFEGLPLQLPEKMDSFGTHWNLPIFGIWYCLYILPLSETHIMQLQKNFNHFFKYSKFTKQFVHMNGLSCGRACFISSSPKMSPLSRGEAQVPIVCICFLESSIDSLGKTGVMAESDLSPKWLPSRSCTQATTLSWNSFECQRIDGFEWKYDAKLLMSCVWFYFNLGRCVL